jgi:hypothetical protein
MGKSKSTFQFYLANKIYFCKQERKSERKIERKKERVKERKKE